MVGNTLTSAVRKQDFVARWGSDEFVVMALGTETASLREIANRVLAMAEWFDTSESMMDKADESLYQGCYPTISFFLTIRSADTRITYVKQI